MKRCTVMIDEETLEKLHEIQRRTGLPMAEQVRQGIRWWLQARDWPERGAHEDVVTPVGAGTATVTGGEAARNTLPAH
jgi:hypothetical protein